MLEGAFGRVAPGPALDDPAAAATADGGPQLGGVEQVKAHLSTLSSLDLTPLDRTEPDLEYLFKHVVTQEVAYESLAYATRATLHEQIGGYIETTYGEEGAIDLLAHGVIGHQCLDDGPGRQPGHHELLRAAEKGAATDLAMDILIVEFNGFHGHGAAFFR